MLIDSKTHFRQLVSDSSRSLKMSLALPVQSYLVNLLCQFISTEQLFDSSTKNHSLLYLSESWTQAQNESTEIQKRIKLQKVGDAALYFSGFFSSTLINKLIDLDYYIYYGSSAYRTLADRSRNKETKDIYKKLDSKFRNYMELLAHISYSCLESSDDDKIFTLLEIYKKTHSKWAAQKLIEKGIDIKSIEKSKAS